VPLLPSLLYRYCNCHAVPPSSGERASAPTARPTATTTTGHVLGDAHQDAPCRENGAVYLLFSASNLKLHVTSVVLQWMCVPVVFTGPFNIFDDKNLQGEAGTLANAASPASNHDLIYAGGHNASGLFMQAYDSTAWAGLVLWCARRWFLCMRLLLTNVNACNPICVLLRHCLFCRTASAAGSCGSVFSLCP